MKAASISASFLLLSIASAQGVLQLDITGKREVGRSTLRRRDSKGTVQTGLSENDLFITYYANITIGTPPQNVRLIIDTGSSDVWAVATGTAVCQETTSGCPGGTFDYTKSSTFDDNGPGKFAAAYVDGTTTTGDYFLDSFGIGGVTVESFQMGLADNTTSSEGIMGIAFDTAEGGGRVQYPNLVDTMVNQSIIATQAYSLWLDDRDARTGSILFGGIDTGKFEGNLANIAMYPSETTGAIDRFSVAFTSLSITSSSGTSDLMKAGDAYAVILDSGTSITFLPDDIALGVFNSVGATYDSTVGAALVDCALADADGSVSFGFAGAQGPVIKVPINEMVSPLFLKDGSQPKFTDGLPACQFGIGPVSSLGEGAPILFGDTMLRSAYVVYDLANFRIGLAQTKFFSKDTNIVAFESFQAQIPSATTVENESAAKQTGASGVVAPPPDATAIDPAAVTENPNFTGAAGPGFATATGGTHTGAGPTATSTDKPKKNIAGLVSSPSWEHVTFVGLAVSVMSMIGGVLI